MAQLRVTAGRVISIPVGSAYVTVMDDGAEGRNELVVEGTDTEGSVLVVTNSDAHPTSGVAVIPSGSTVLLVHNGLKWLDVHALHAPIRELRGVRSFEAVADLTIGDVTFAAGRLQATHLTPGRVLVAGPKGVLIDSASLTFHATGLSGTGTQGVLSAPALRVGELVGDVDVGGFELKNAVLRNAKLVDASLVDMHVHAASLVLPGLAGVGLLGTNDKGEVVGAGAVRAAEVTVGAALVVEKDASLTLQGLGQGLGRGLGDASGSTNQVQVLVLDREDKVTVGTVQEVLKGSTLDGLVLTGATLTGSTGASGSEAATLRQSELA